MASIRESLASFFENRFGPSPERVKEQEKTEQAIRLLNQAYLDGPWLTTPEHLLEQLREIDNPYLVDMIHSLYYENLGQMGTYSTDDEAERLRAVDESRRLYKYDVVTAEAIGIWTDFGFGVNVKVSPEDEDAQAVWDEFWTADRNASLLADDELQALSEDTLVDGEKFLVYFISTLDGLVTLREIDTKEITEIVTDPNDNHIPLFYKRTYSNKTMTGIEMYYPDWQAAMAGALDKLPEDLLPKGAKRADEQEPGTLVVCHHIAHNRKGALRGWPISTAAAPWVRTHRQFRENRATVSAAMAMYVRKLKVSGGSRAVDAMRTKMQSALTQTNYTDTNPPAAAGSTFIENQAAELTDLPKGTAAGDAKEDGLALMRMAGLGFRLYPHYLGEGDAYRLATVNAMELPVKKLFTRYQKFWSSHFKKMCRIVLWAAETYGGKSFENTKCDVSMDKLLDFNLADLSSLTATVFNPNYEAGLIPTEAAKGSIAQVWRIILQLLGVENADELTSDEAFEIGDYAPPEEPEPEPAPPVIPQVQVIAPPPESEEPEEDEGAVAEAVRELRAELAEMIARAEGAGNGAHE